MYEVIVAPVLSDMLIDYAQQIASEHGMECALKLIDSFDNATESLKEIPQHGIRKLAYIPSRYYLITFWKHLWFIYQVDAQNNKEYIDYMIDDRSVYGRLFNQ